jgi:uncharacterized membrane protein YccC
MRSLLTLHSIIYRLILGAVILAVVVPYWTSGHKPMWPIAVVTIIVVTAAGVLLARQPRLHDWLRRR